MLLYHVGLVSSYKLQEIAFWLEITYFEMYNYTSYGFLSYKFLLSRRNEIAFTFEINLVLDRNAERNY